MTFYVLIIYRHKLKQAFTLVFPRKMVLLKLENIRRDE